MYKVSPNPEGQKPSCRKSDPSTDQKGTEADCVPDSMRDLACDLIRVLDDNGKGREEANRDVAKDDKKLPINDLTAA